MLHKTVLHYNFKEVFIKKLFYERKKRTKTFLRIGEGVVEVGCVKIFNFQKLGKTSIVQLVVCLLILLQLRLLNIKGYTGLNLNDGVPFYP